MKRDQHKIELKNSVLKSARKLFISQGYSKTTINQIIKESHITTGSLYHFFKNKEDILLNIARDMFAIAAEASDSLQFNENDPCLRFALEIGLQLDFIVKYERIAEIYLAAYTSCHISELIVRMGTIRNRELFREYNPEFTDDDYYARTLAVKGILHSFVDELVNFKRIKDRKRIDSILEMILLIFNVPEDRIKRTIKKTQTIIMSKPVKAMTAKYYKLISSDAFI
jgi:AcrR family transcriptional regulator